MNWRKGYDSNNNDELISSGEAWTELTTGRTYQYYPHGKAIRQPILSALTPELRADELIRYYGHDPLIRRQLSQSIWIKPEFAICLSQAETGVGRHTKSENNLWNCHNNDRGDTKSYDGLLTSFKDLGDSCLNWKYLSKKTNLHHLYPNSPDSHCSQPNSDPSCKYVYASSKFSNRNLQNCLSNIYDKQIDMDFKFRLEI